MKIILVISTENYNAIESEIGYMYISGKIIMINP